MNEVDAHLHRIWRATLTRAALLTRDEVIAALPGDPTDVGAWLDAHVAATGRVAGTAVFRWGDVLDVVGGGPADADQPITSWKAAAAALGVSEDTLSRRRRERDPAARPYFDNADDLRAWWKALIAPAPAHRPRDTRKRATKAMPSEGDQSWSSYARELISSRRGSE